MSWVCYVLRCADDTLYCGITNDLDKRLATHNAGEGAKYTRGRTPVQLAYSESCPDKSAALKREMEIKAWSRVKKLELLEVAQKCPTPKPARGEELPGGRARLSPVVLLT